MHRRQLELSGAYERPERSFALSILARAVDEWTEATPLGTGQASSSGAVATYVADDIAAARLQCEKWWQEWCNDGEIPSEEDRPAALCDLGEWPPADADSSRRLFATVMYEIAGRYQDAAKTYIAAASADSKTVVSVDLTESYDYMCRKAHGMSALEQISAAASPLEAAAKLAVALRKGHEAFAELVASHKAVRVLAASASVGTTTATLDEASHATEVVSRATVFPSCQCRVIARIGNLGT